MMLVTMLGKRWKFLFTPLRKASGYCDPPAQTGKRIVVDSRLRGEHRLGVIIHELRHAADWGRDEGFVDQESKDLTRVLWRLEYRRADDE